MKTFTVYRRGDLSETHDKNQANPSDMPQYEGVVFTDGTCAIRWLTPCSSTSVWWSFDDMWAIHGHQKDERYKTEIVWGHQKEEEAGAAPKTFGDSDASASWTSWRPGRR